MLFCGKNNHGYLSLFWVLKGIYFARLNELLSHQLRLCFIFSFNSSWEALSCHPLKASWDNDCCFLSFLISAFKRQHKMEQNIPPDLYATQCLNAAKLKTDAN